MTFSQAINLSDPISENLKARALLMECPLCRTDCHVQNLISACEEYSVNAAAAAKIHVQGKKRSDGMVRSKVCVSRHGALHLRFLHCLSRSALHF